MEQKTFNLRTHHILSLCESFGNNRPSIWHYIFDPKRVPKRMIETYGKEAYEAEIKRRKDYIPRNKIIRSVWRSINKNPDTLIKIVQAIEDMLCSCCPDIEEKCKISDERDDWGYPIGQTLSFKIIYQLHKSIYEKKYNQKYREI